jgi:exonuclease SbcC
MHILALDLENVKSYSRAHIRFAAGVNAIVGHNGAGKSTILEAIGFVLFDHTPYRPITDFVREGAKTGIAAVHILSADDERPYRVERRFGSSNSYVVYDGELQTKIAEGKADVLQFVRRHGRIEPTLDLARLFEGAIGVPQGLLTAAFLDQPGVRKAHFDALLQVDEYRRAADNLAEPQRLLRQRLQALERTTAELAGRLQRLPGLEQATQERTAAIAAAEIEAGELAGRLALSEARVAALDAERALVESLGRQAQRAEGLLALARQQVEQTQRALAEAQEAAHRVAGHQAGFDAYQAAQERQKFLAEQRRRQRALQEQLAGTDKQLALCTAELTNHEHLLAEIAQAEAELARLAPLAARQSELEAELARLAELGVRQTELDRQTAQQERRLEQAQQRRAFLLEQQVRAAAIEDDLLRLGQVTTELTARKEELATAAGVCEADGKAAQKQAETLRDIKTAVCPVCEQPLPDERRLELLARNEAAVDGLRRRFRELSDDLKGTNQELQRHAEEQAVLQRERLTLPRAGELAETEQTLSELECALAEACSDRARLAEELATAPPLRAELEALGNPRQAQLLAQEKARQRGGVERQQAETVRRRAEAAAAHGRVAEQLADYARLDEELVAVEQALAEHRAAYETVLSHRQAAGAVATRAAEVQTAEERLRQEQEAASAAQEQLAAAQLRFDPQQHQAAAGELSALRSRQASLGTRLQMLELEQQRDAVEMEQLHAERTTYDELQRQHGAVAKQEQTLDTIRGVVKQAGPYVTQALIRQVSAAAARIFGELMQDYSRYLRWNDDYGLTLEVGSNVRQFAQLSGGEQMSAALAVRLALVRELSNVGLAFFDEPTANLDDVRRETLVQQITTVKGFGQLFVISHDDTFEQATQNIIRLRRSGDATVVEDASMA